MTKNPIFNALAASGYIILIVSVMYWGTKIAPKPDTIIAPLSAVSLFTLSAAVMGYIFLSKPIQLYLDDKKKEAIDLFLKTVAIFGCLTFIILALLFSGAFT